MKTQKEIEDTLHAAMDNCDRSKWPGMTYEQGVANALGWVLGENDTNPMED